MDIEDAGKRLLLAALDVHKAQMTIADIPPSCFDAEERAHFLRIANHLHAAFEEMAEHGRRWQDWNTLYALNPERPRA